MRPEQHFHRLFAYDHWANRECMEALRAAGAQDPVLVRLMAHTLSAQKLWLERLEQKSQSMPVWPHSSIQECIALADELALAWKRYLAELPEDGFQLEIEYRNSKGEPWTSRVEDVLTHVLMHSTYHRGQLALQMRASGLEPAYTDFIHAVRRGFVE